MKYIKKFYESSKKSPEEELSSQLDFSEIEDYFQENYSIDITEVLENAPEIVWNNIDEERFKEDFISNEIDSMSLEDFSTEDYIDFIQDNLSDDKMKQVVEIYKENRGDDEGDDEGEYEYEDDMLSDLTDEQLRELIEMDNQEEEFIEDRIKSRYEDERAADIIENLYGGFSGQELYNIVGSYIDDEEIINEYTENESYDYKVEFLEGYIFNDTELQRKLLDLKDSNVLLLAQIFENNSKTGNQICDEYEFQIKYIEQYTLKHKDEESEDMLKATALKYLYDNFELNYHIEEEFSDYRWLIDSEKFNL